MDGTGDAAESLNDGAACEAMASGGREAGGESRSAAFRLRLDAASSLESGFKMDETPVSLDADGEALPPVGLGG